MGTALVRVPVVPSTARRRYPRPGSGIGLGKWDHTASGQRLGGAVAVSMYLDEVGVRGFAGRRRRLIKRPLPHVLRVGGSWRSSLRRPTGLRLLLLAFLADRARAVPG